MSQLDAERLVHLLDAGFNRANIAAILGTDLDTIHAVLADPASNDLPASGGSGLAPDYANSRGLTGGEIAALATGDGKAPTVATPCMVLVNLSLDSTGADGTANVGVLYDSGNSLDTAAPGRAAGKTTVVIPYVGPGQSWYAVVDGVGGASAVVGAVEIPLVAG
jgi:hypothetical protein